MSSATAKVKREYKKVCDEIDQEMLDEHGYIFCVSCGERDTGLNGLAHSHLLPKGTYPKYETVKENINIRCLDCHRDLDGSNFDSIQYFKDLDEIMEYLANNEPGVHNLFVMGLEGVGCSKYEYVEFDK